MWGKRGEFQTDSTQISRQLSQFRASMTNCPIRKCIFLLLPAELEPSVFICLSVRLSVCLSVSLLPSFFPIQTSEWTLLPLSQFQRPACHGLGEMRPCHRPFPSPPQFGKPRAQSWGNANLFGGASSTVRHTRRLNTSLSWASQQQHKRTSGN